MAQIKCTPVLGQIILNDKPYFLLLTDYYETVKQPSVKVEDNLGIKPEIHEHSRHGDRLKVFKSKLRTSMVSETHLDANLNEDSNISYPEGDHDNKDHVKTPVSPSYTVNNNNNNNNTIKPTVDDLSKKGQGKVPEENVHECPYCKFCSVNEMHIKTHVLSKHPHSDLACPLCQEPFGEKSKIETHLKEVHNVNTEGLQKLLLLVEDHDHPKMPPMTVREASLPNFSAMSAEKMEINLDALENESAKLLVEDAIDLSSSADADDQFRCQTCSKAFTNIDQLYSHQNELGHLELKQTPRGPGYLCWKKGCNQYFKTAQALQMHFREIHAKMTGPSSAERSEYKYPCQICTLAFKSQQKLHFHAQMHVIRSAVSCNLCPKTFLTIHALHKHVETSHELSESEREQYRAEIHANTMAISAFMSDSRLTKVFRLTEVDKEKCKGFSTHEDVEMRDAQENGGIDSESSSKDNSPSSTPVSMENGLENSNDDLEKGDGDFGSKDQQFFEDYINSQAFAEGTYEDPNRKYKCHRCRVAFTKQNYLAAHNKTLLHRKGERYTYPMEKFLDPNRPYKCDVCKESFTQKNILLVHNNSVSHLHKVKQATSNSPLPFSTSTSTSLSSQPPTTSVSASDSAMSSATSSTVTSSSTSADHISRRSRESREMSPDDDGDRPFKCNICKVSYSQGSTLDIHIRSVAHQTRASKLHELAMSGEVDLTRPLIEEPIDKALQAQQQKFLNEFLSKQTSVAHQSMLFQGLHGLPGLGSYPGFPSLPSLAGLPLLAGLPPLLPLSLPNQVFQTSIASSTSSQPHFSSSSRSLTSVASSSDSLLTSTRSLEKLSQQAMIQQSKQGSSGADIAASTSSSLLTQSQSIPSGSIHVCQRCSAVFASQESYVQHQMYCSGSSLSPTTGQAGSNRSRFVGRIKTAVQRNLLENFGFECVMQFNEFNQRIPKEDDTSKNPTNPEENAVAEGKPTCKEDEKDNQDAETKDDSKAEKSKDECTSSSVDLPEMNKCKCSHCGKQFSSVWVLKAHEEEVHKEIVPIEKVETFGDQFKSDLEKKMPKPEPDAPPTPIPSTPPIPEEKVIKQEMPPPPPPPPAQISMDMLQMMNLINMGMMPMPMPMFSQGSLMPMMMPPPGMDQVLKSPGISHFESQSSANNMSMSQKQQMQNASMANQKRARTRINDEQLKVLRGYFDINNSPAEEQIQAMSEQTGLPMKVIKHWFRNTLFKERQRNKDSPYNFNNPPSTTLDLEEYEKTGKLTIIEDGSPVSSENPGHNIKDVEIKKEPVEKPEESESPRHDKNPRNEDNKTIEAITKPVNNPPIMNDPPKTPQTIQPSPVSTPSNPAKSSPATPVPVSQNSLPLSVSPTPSKLTHPGTNESLMSSFAYNFSAMSTPSTPNYPPTSTTPTSTPLYENHNYSPPGGSSGRRANRTRFTDYQIKCLQEYFEQNAYPKDDELEHLSKMLGLSPRVIVVWFQNARQKARKIYENQPADGGKDMSSSSSTSPFSRTSGLNYQCKKCQAVFQRYYDLIRHQKRHCFTDGEKQESHMMSDDSDSISNVTSLDNTYFSDSESECSSTISKSTKDLNSSQNEGSMSSMTRYQCDKCDMTFHQLELFKEHKAIHNMNPGLFLNLPTSSAFGVLQTMANTSQQNCTDDRSPAKRKYDEEIDDPDQPRDKRLRTTILPEQLDYLYQKYQIDCNPSRKQLEAISKDVGLKKRVVQVWFQNTRARERKGQYRAHQQLIHKRCPICRALFRAKSALESHLATKHPDEMAKGDINIDNIPDAAIESPAPSSSSVLSPPPDYNKLLAPPGMQGLLPYMPPVSLGLGFPPMADPIQMSMKQFYEDSFKKYINELSSTSHSYKSPSSASLLPHELTSTPLKSESHVMSSVDDEAPLDLSKPLKVSTPADQSKNRDGPTSHSSHSSALSSVSHNDRSRQNSGPGILESSVDQSYMMKRFNQDSALHHEIEMSEDETCMSSVSSNPTSPAQQSMHSSHNMTNKRYRTQMTSLQVRIMKNIFIDYKTPTMAECEMLGGVIGLQKRVVQVWFQNARAKEKKAKLNQSKTFGQEVDFPKPPEECTLCNFKYSHKYTIQDHIFTKKHIDKVKEYIQSQSDAERELSSSASSMVGVSGLLRSQQPNDVDHMRKLMEEANNHSHMAQLQSMGLGPLGLAPGNMSGMGLLNPGDYLHEMKKESASTEKSRKGGDKSEGSSKKESRSGGSMEAHFQGMGMLSPFGSLMPGVDPGMLPYMYQGLPGIMPPLQSGFLPGAEHMLGYDPMTYGTPLPLLQIPQQAIRDVSSKLMEPKATIGQYTQDCKSIGSLRSLVSNIDYNCAREATVDVGYICKKCQMVYPVKDACMSHQRIICFPGGKIHDAINVILKLEQIQYECKLCLDKFSTVSEFKSHCGTEGHKMKVAKYQQQKASATPQKLSHPVSSTPSPRPESRDNKDRPPSVHVPVRTSSV